MDHRRLFQAAWTGDVDYLRQELDTDPSLLHRVMLAGGETPLHVACLAGQLNFATSVMSLNQEFSRELNEDGFTPLHVASACGHVEIVKEILKVDLDCCMIKGKEGRIALHFAVVKGRLDVVEELLSASADSVECRTARGETPLHLAVKHNQFECFRVLVEHIKKHDKEDLLNSSDVQGNTILHLAVSKKQYEVVDFLLNGQVATKEKVELNPLNKSNLTPLDVLLLFQSEAGDREIEEILIHHGASKAGNQTHGRMNMQQTPSHQETTSGVAPQSPARKLLDYFKYSNVKESPSEVRGTLLVIAVLIVTATYQSIQSPPGGVWGDDYTPVTGNTTSTTNATAGKAHTAGQAVMGTHNPISYGIFLFANSIGFYMSLYMINVLTAGFPLRLELQVSAVALYTTYGTSMGAISSSNGTITIIFNVISCVLPVTIPFMTMLLRNHLKTRRNVSASRDEERVSDG